MPDSNGAVNATFTKTPGIGPGATPVLPNMMSIPDPALVRPQKLCDVIAEHVRTQIVRGELSPGDTLTLEADLLKKFQVSRPTLREALRVLESEGLIKLGRGARRGATVLAPSIRTAAKHSALYLATHGTTVGEVHQVRTMIEPSLVALLAERPGKECLQAFRACAEMQHDAIEAKNYEAAISSLDELHRLMIKYTENRALGLLAGVLGNIPAVALRQPLMSGSEATRRTLQRRLKKAVEAHRQLVELVAAKDPARAEAFWHSYMVDTGRFLSDKGFASLPIRAPAGH